VEIGDSFYLEYNDALADFILESLQYVGYDIYVYDNTWNSFFKLPVLQSTGDDLEIYDNEGLTAIEIATASILDVGYDFEVSSNVGLQTILVPGLRSVYDDLEINYNLGLLSVDIATTTDLSVGYMIEVYDNNDYDECSYSECAESVEELSLWTLNIPGLVYTYDDIEIDYNRGLTSIMLATVSPASLDYDVDIYENPDLLTINIPQLTFIGDDLTIGYNPLLTSVSIPNLTYVDSWLQIYNNGTPGTFTLDLNALEMAYYLDIENNPGLGSVDLSSLESVSNDLWIQGNHLLANLALPSLLTVGDDFGIYDNDGLQNFSAPQLGVIGSYADVSYNNALTTFGLGGLTALSSASAVDGPAQVTSSFGEFYVVENPLMTGFDLSSLAQVGYVYMNGNNAMTTLGTFGPLGATTTLEIQYHDNLQNLNGLSSVTSALGAVRIVSNTALTDVTGLQGIGSAAAGDPVVSGDLTFTANTALPCPAVPALFTILDGRYSGAAVGGTYSNTGNPACAPTVADVSPSTVTAGERTIMTITGTNLHHAKGVSVCFLAAVEGGLLTSSADGTTVTVPVTWGASEVGSRCVNVDTPQGVISGNVTLVVN